MNAACQMIYSTLKWWAYHSTASSIPLAQSPAAHWLQARRPCLQMSTLTDTCLSCWWTPTAGELWIPSTSAIFHYTITDCLPHHPLHRQWPGISGCCCTYLEQSVSARHLGVVTISVQSSSEDPSLLILVSCWSLLKFWHYNPSFIYSFDHLFIHS